MKRIALSTALVLSFAAPALAEDAAEFNLLIASTEKTENVVQTNHAAMSASSSSNVNARSNVFHEPVGR
ncbi:hypothetical protein [Pseudohalocynthiibacter sp. F2068]|uniref:hypothetical protein n=1 Tax=Pseudohalocynthiibacter sp. F2068 TaxID=2926418 RepID=UPI001FF0FFC9|nr:hypothetical protein [Pseudohalocynthiibacter sp. F2068]MCK0103254.1 hypothetical protein [Pseudohalocynthiibacter sp. F2068]